MYDRAPSRENGRAAPDTRPDRGSRNNRQSKCARKASHALEKRGILASNAYINTIGDSCSFSDDGLDGRSPLLMAVDFIACGGRKYGGLWSPYWRGNLCLPSI